MEGTRDPLLGPYRVLDLANETGQLCAKLLGDLGADVVKVERPGGDSSRRLGPFYKGEPNAERSLFWFAYNTSKKGITLNLETEDGRKIFGQLVKKADFVIETFHPGYLDALGLGYNDLSQINPRLIMTSVTPFGQTGPCKDFKSSDIVAMATGGFMALCGDTDRPPLRCTAELSYPIAGAWAAVATLIAHHHRELRGEGQHVDISVQECVLSGTWTVTQSWDIGRTLVNRAGHKTLRGNVEVQTLWRCKDGYVCWRLFTGGLGRRTQAIVDWMAEEHMVDYLVGVKWEDLDWDQFKQEDVAYYERPFREFFLTKTKNELLCEALRRGFILLPVNANRDVVQDDQLRARNFWVDVEHPELQSTFCYPGAPFKTNKGIWRIRHRAPLIGEHNVEIYSQELGYSKEDLQTLRQANVI